MRFFQVIRWSWTHAGCIEHGLRRAIVFADILGCYAKWRMWSNQYLTAGMWGLSAQERARVGREMLARNIVRDAWQRDFRENRKFLRRYMSYRYELASLRGKRNRAYTERYNMGKGCHVEHGVEISRQHYLPGTIKVGDRTLLAKNAFIDYSGHVVIGSDVQITDGVHILSHDHKHHHAAAVAGDYPDNDVQRSIEICDGAVIGTRAVILPSCSRIGRFARIGAGAVVTKDVPDYAVVVGVPARVIGSCEPRIVGITEKASH